LQELICPKLEGYKDIGSRIVKPPPEKVGYGRRKREAPPEKEGSSRLRSEKERSSARKRRVLKVTVGEREKLRPKKKGAQSYGRRNGEAPPEKEGISKIRSEKERSCARKRRVLKVTVGEMEKLPCENREIKVTVVRRPNLFH
jgi:hypothetical protein